MFVQTQITPNPNALKFLPDLNNGMGEFQLNQGAEFTSKRDAQDHPLARLLFDLDGVAGVFFGADFISITKTSNMSWEQIKPDILGVLVDFLTSDVPLTPAIKTTPSTIIDSPLDSPQPQQSDNQLVADKIKEIIKTRIQPVVAQDGGDISFERFEKGVAYLNLHGACAGCPSSMMTLKNGVENLLRYYVSELERVEATEIIS